MTSIFFDTSALVRRYDPLEPDSVEVHSICTQAEGRELLVARHITVEMASAFARKHREGRFDAVQTHRAWILFLSHLRFQYRVIEFSEPVYAGVERLVFAHTLRAFDALHISCALRIEEEFPGDRVQFWTDDRRQSIAARTEGLAVRLVG